MSWAKIQIYIQFGQKDGDQRNKKAKTPPIGVSHDSHYASRCHYASGCFLVLAFVYQSLCSCKDPHGSLSEFGNSEEVCSTVDGFFSSSPVLWP